MAPVSRFGRGLVGVAVATVLAWVLAVGTVLVVQAQMSGCAGDAARTNAGGPALVLASEGIEKYARIGLNEPQNSENRENLKLQLESLLSLIREGVDPDDVQAKLIYQRAWPDVNKLYTDGVMAHNNAGVIGPGVAESLLLRAEHFGLLLREQYNSPSITPIPPD